ncbi:hypothetical protein GGI43DRAFT_364112 [Trichoderma evansii]
MQFLNIFVVLAALLAPILTRPSPGVQQAGDGIIDAENAENSCRPRLTSCKADKECCSRSCLKWHKIKVCK